MLVHGERDTLADRQHVPSFPRAIWFPRLIKSDDENLYERTPGFDDADNANSRVEIDG
jgi:hypothetical protein